MAASEPSAQRMTLSPGVKIPSGEALAVAMRVHFDLADPARYLVMTEALPESALSEAIRDVCDRTLIVSGTLLPPGLFAVWWLIGLLIRPLSTMSKAAAALERGERNADIAPALEATKSERWRAAS